MRPGRRYTLLAITAVIVLAFALAVVLEGPSRRAGSTAASGSGSGFEGSLVPAGVRARDFTLTDQNGHKVTLDRYKGQVTILTFLYSTCKDVCPLIIQQIRGALDDLGRPVPALAISVSPEHDTPSNVRTFLQKASLATRMEYLTGSRSTLEPLWRSYGILPESAGEAASDHSAYVLLIDRHGVERVAFGVEQLTPEGLAHDVRRLQAQS
ncbi:MAG TPA: SCO family protein [Solirubrobacteraceae bacterium]|jgi:protein SCO1/2